MPTDDPTGYVHGHHESVLRSHRARTVATSAGYLVAHLRPGVRLLDVGCGPGTLTADLARHVAPGPVVGTDSAPAAVTAATAELARQGVDNARVVTADLFAPGADLGRFDVVHAHQVLQHLPDPVEGLRRMAVACAPGGVVAARDADYAAFTWYPQVPALQEWLALYRALVRRAGGEPDAGRRLLSWARAAGLEQVTATASVWCYADPDSRAWWGGLWADRIVASSIAEQAVAAGLATPAELQRLRAGWLEWAQAPDGWFVVPHGEIVARVGDPVS